MKSSVFKRMFSGNWLLTPAAIWILLFCLSACSSSLTPEEEISRYVRKAEKAFANRDAGDLHKLISSEYTDKRNLKRDEIRRILAGYFLRDGKTFVLTNMTQLSFSAGHTIADFRLFAALSSQPLEKDDLQLLDADCYLLTGTLGKNGEWLLTTAELQSITVDEFISSFN